MMLTIPATFDPGSFHVISTESNSIPRTVPFVPTPKDFLCIGQSQPKAAPTGGIWVALMFYSRVKFKLMFMVNLSFSLLASCSDTQICLSGGRGQQSGVGYLRSGLLATVFAFTTISYSYVQRGMPWVNAVNADLAILDSKPGSGNFVCGNRPFSVCHQCLFSDLHLVGDQQKQLILNKNFQDSRCNAIILTFSTSEMFVRKPLSRECL